ncbi:MAG: hypothetical protein LIR50_19255 [Bacillota bacterium]|nr:hypothetical protein [Bacillota bacterium]
MNLDLYKIIKATNEKKQKMPRIRKDYEKYKHDFINNGGLEQNIKLLSYEEYKEANEKDC